MSGLLLHGPADIFARLLIVDGKGADPDVGGAWLVYVSNEPNEPDNCLFTKDTSPRLGGFNMPDQEQHELYGIQLKIRAKDYPTGISKFNQLKVAVNDYTRMTVTINTTAYEITTVVMNSIILGYNTPKDRRWSGFINLIAAITMTAQ